MKKGLDISRITALIGDPARANILTALMSGKALTATELAAEAGVTPQTTSTHLAKLEAGGLVTARKSGRHKYFTVSRPEVADVLEALMGVAAGAGHLRTRTGPSDLALRQARVCYNHLAGEKGIALFDCFVARGLLVDQAEVVSLTDDGRRFVAEFGVDLAALEHSKTPLCRPCLDWSGRRNHLAGSVGRALLTRIQTLGWANRVKGTRILRFTPAGATAFEKAFA